MKKIFWVILACLILIAVGCGSNAITTKNMQHGDLSWGEQNTAASDESEEEINTDNKEDVSMKGAKLKIIVGNKEMIATLEDNAATRAFVKKLPMALPMQNLYSREMCYRYGAGSLPTSRLRSDRYEVGDIVYWPPRGSFVILYAQNGEKFERQQIGHIDHGVELFNQSGDVTVKFELVK